MARYEVFDNPSGDGYLLDVQADILDDIQTRMVVPLFPPRGAPSAANRLNPVFVVDGDRVVMMTQLMASVPRQILRNKKTSLRNRHDEIVAALEMLFHGF